MRKTTINGKRYISLGDFEHLRHNLVRDIYDKYEKDENGQILMRPEDVGAISAYCHIMTQLLKEEYEEARLDSTTPEELRRNYDLVYARLKHEWQEGSYIIVGESNGEKVYFRKMCPYAPKDEDAEQEDEQKDTPVFTSLKRQAEWWHDYYEATMFCESLKKQTGIESLHVVPAWQEFMTNAEAKKLLDAIFDEGDEKYENNRL